MRTNKRNKHIDTMKRLRLFEERISKLSKAEREHWNSRYVELRAEHEVAESLDELEQELDACRPES